MEFLGKNMEHISCEIAFFLWKTLRFQNLFLSLQLFLLMLKAPWGNQTRRGTYIQKAFSERFGFGDVGISHIRTDCQKQSNGNVSWWCSICTHSEKCVTYIHRRGAFSIARFDRQGMREPLDRGPGTELAPRFFRVYAKTTWNYNICCGCRAEYCNILWRDFASV